MVGLMKRNDSDFRETQLPGAATMLVGDHRSLPSPPTMLVGDHWSLPSPPTMLVGDHRSLPSLPTIMGTIMRSLFPARSIGGARTAFHHLHPPYVAAKLG